MIMEGFYIYTTIYCLLRGTTSLTATATAAAITSIADTDRISALSGWISDIIHFNFSKLHQMFFQTRIHIYNNTIGIYFFKTVGRLIQSHSQLGTASASTHIVQDQVFILVLIGA